MGSSDNQTQVSSQKEKKAGSILISVKGRDNPSGLSNAPAEPGGPQVRYDLHIIQMLRRIIRAVDVY
ncbi:MAG TPA: hypothetical protein VM123_21610 [archaeon]|nr:hypothetical protein [archaeon]